MPSNTGRARLRKTLWRNALSTPLIAAGPTHAAVKLHAWEPGAGHRGKESIGDQREFTRGEPDGHFFDHFLGQLQ